MMAVIRLTLPTHYRGADRLLKKSSAEATRSRQTAPEGGLGASIRRFVNDWRSVVRVKPREARHPNKHQAAQCSLPHLDTQGNQDQERCRILHLYLHALLLPCPATKRTIFLAQASIIISSRKSLANGCGVQVRRKLDQTKRGRVIENTAIQAAQRLPIRSRSRLLQRRVSLEERRTRGRS